MDVLCISILLGIVFLLQSILGFLQIRNFVKTFRNMSRNGKILIGKNPKKFRAGTLILLNIDRDANIKDAKIMKGVTIFARFKEFKVLNGKSLPLLASDYNQLQKYDSLTRECILNAYRNYINYKTGKLSRSDLDTSTNFLSLPVFDLWKNELISKFNAIKRRRQI
ncbi:transcriptional regulator GutM [Lactobacillus sp. PSON]|uniref:transcriptional regulator GutM n=1 Tax=Lactobacillus sp. PSON TaxID=3455454 RepID=UPI004041FF96